VRVVINAVIDIGILRSFCSWPRTHRIEPPCLRMIVVEESGILSCASPTKFDLVINQQTVRAIGIEILPAILARATEVIE
jgi:hypothetical protein